MDNRLQEVETELRRVLATDSPTLRQIIEYFLQVNGKGTRPLLVLLCGEVSSSPKEYSVDLAVAVELLHMASLVHDDILDQSPIRRKQPTIHNLWDERTAVLVGDYFFGKMLKIISRYPQVVLYFSDVIQSLVTGEFMQIEQRYNAWLPEEFYLERIYHKTANFIATCCKISSIASDASSEIRESLTNFGYYLGMAYQLLDDLQDFGSHPDLIGKPVLQDATQGIYTLSVLHAVRQSYVSAESLEQLQHLPDDSLAYGKHVTSRYIQKALYSLSQLPNTEAKTALQFIALKLKQETARLKGEHQHATSIH